MAQGVACDLYTVASGAGSWQHYSWVCQSRPFNRQRWTHMNLSLSRSSFHTSRWCQCKGEERVSPQVYTPFPCWGAPRESWGCLLLPGTANQNNTWHKHWRERWCWTATIPETGAPTHSCKAKAVQFKPCTHTLAMESCDLLLFAAVWYEPSSQKGKGVIRFSEVPHKPGRSLQDWRKAPFESRNSDKLASETPSDSIHIQITTTGRPGLLSTKPSF